MKHREYWLSRAIALEYYLQEDATATINEIQKLYGVALENIDEEIQNIRKELGKITGAITEGDLNELLNKAERDKSYSELQDLLEVAETDDERLDIMNRINAQAYGARITRLDSVGNKILSEFTKVAAQEKVLCRELFANVLQEAYYTNIHNLAEGYNAGVSFDVLPNRAINKALNAPWSGGNYSSRIWKHSQEFTDQVQETVIKGLMTGQSRTKIASELMEYTDSTRYVAERLVRTETAHFLAEGQKEAYEAAGIEKYRFLAALSERTCETCAELDSKVFDLDEATEGVNYPPMHPNCRCVTITADAKLSTRLARDPVTGENYKVDGNMTFAEWKESLSDEQRAAMNKYVDNSDKHGIINISSPINSRNDYKGRPRAVFTLDVELKERQQKLLDSLPLCDSSVIVRKRDVNMVDLAALTAKTGVEFALFTRGSERLVIRGGHDFVNVTLDDAKRLAEKGYKFSGHTHPGGDTRVLMASGDDYEILKAFKQKKSVTYNSKGQYMTYELRGGKNG